MSVFMSIPTLNMPKLENSNTDKIWPSSSSYETLTHSSNICELLFELVSSQHNKHLCFCGKADEQCGCRFARMSPNHRNTWPLTGSPLLSLEVAVN